MSAAATHFRISVFFAALIAAGASYAAQAPAPPAPAEPPPPNSAAAAAEMMIEAGRLGVMLDQADAAMKLRTEPSEESVETPTQQLLYVVHELRAAVLRHNMMQFDACRGGQLSGAVCAQPYLPEWLKEPPDAVPPSATLAARVHEAVNRIMPLWNAMCAKATAQTHDETFCAIE